MSEVWWVAGVGGRVIKVILVDKEPVLIDNKVLSS